MSNRIVSLISSATEIVHALGLGEQMVGRSHECDYPPTVSALPQCSSPNIEISASSRVINHQVKESILKALSIYSVDRQALEHVLPTHIVTQTQCEVCAVSLNDVQQALSGLVSSQPEIISLSAVNLAGLWEDIQRIADALGVSENGKTLVRDLQKRLEAIKEEYTSKLEQKPSVLCLEWLDPLMAAGNWMPELVKIAGGEPVLAQAGEHSPQFSWDDLKRVDPDVIAVMPCGFDISRSLQEIGTLFGNPDFFELRAVRQGRVYIADGTQFFNRSGPRLVESAEILGEMIYDTGRPEATNRFHRTAWLRMDEC